MKIWKITAVLCCLIMAFSLVGCKRSAQPVDTIDVSEGEVLYTGGTHVFNIKKTNRNIVENGKSEYKIVVPADAESEITVAADEIKVWVQKSTGVILETLTDADAAWSSSAKYISLGDTKTAEAAGVALTEEVGFSGYQIKSKGECVFVLGETDSGVLFGAYELLYDLVNFRAYSSDEYAYDEKTEIAFSEYDVTDIPDFNYRVTAYGLSTNDAYLARRLRYNQSDDVWIPVDGATWHNTFKYLPPETYKTEHPKWYSGDGTQLCFLAHGDEAEAEELYQTLLAKLISCLEEYPDRQNITITQEDKRTWCDCAACKENLQKYGTDAATVVQFCNRIAEDVEKYFAEKNSSRQVNICFRLPYDDERARDQKRGRQLFSRGRFRGVPRQRVRVLRADRRRLLAFLLRNGKRLFRGNDGRVRALSDKLYLWLYSTNFHYYLYPFNSFNSMQGNYWFALNRGGSYMFDQGQWNNSNSTGWGRLKVWLNSKLQWDSSLNMNELIDEFFGNYYKQAAEPMRELFDLYRMQCVYIEETLNTTGGIYLNNVKSEFWPQSTLNALLGKIDEAYAAIEPLKESDGELYASLRDRICLESLAYRYLYIELYSGRMTSGEALEEKNSFKEDCTALNVTKVKEGGDISELWASWGIA